MFLSAGATVLVAQTRYIAFGDSITEGFGDDPDRPEQGYPPRLEEMLVEQGRDAEVLNRGLGGETTTEGVTRIDDVLLEGGEVLLLMEGTNDVSDQVSQETILFNLDQMAIKARRQGFEPVMATVIPRLPTANTDGTNVATGGLARGLRELAWDRERRLVDPFEIFFTTPEAFDTLYTGGTDRLHPNAAGYDVIAAGFLDVLTGIDSVGPVPGRISPAPGAVNVPEDSTVEVDVYDFGAGIDVSTTTLLLNDEPVDATIDGDEQRVQLIYAPADAHVGVVRVGVRSDDLADPINSIDRELGRFTVENTIFLDGDIDRDGRVDGFDLVLLALRFGSERGQGRYRGFADLNNDDIVDGEDLAILAANFGESSF